MTQKKWRWNGVIPWLNGGLIAVSVAILLFLLTEFVPNYCTTQSSGVDQCYSQIYLIIKPLQSLMLSLDFIGLFICHGFCQAWNFTNLFTILPSYFFIGAFLGLVYEKLKQAF